MFWKQSQTSLKISKNVQSDRGLLLSANWVIGYYKYVWMKEGPDDTLCMREMNLSVHFAHARRHVCWWFLFCNATLFASLSLKLCCLFLSLFIQHLAILWWMGRFCFVNVILLFYLQYILKWNEPSEQWLHSQTWRQYQVLWSHQCYSYKFSKIPDHTNYSITSWFEPGWLVYRGWFELFFQSLQNPSNSSRKQIFRDFFSYFIMELYVVGTH